MSGRFTNIRFDGVRERLRTLPTYSVISFFGGLTHPASDWCLGGKGIENFQLFSDVGWT